MRIESLELLPLGSSEIGDTWDLIRKYHIYQADALQLVQCLHSKADRLVSADKALLGIAQQEGLHSIDIEDPEETARLGY